MKREPAIFSWSGGKDSAMALHEIQKDVSYEVVGLLTTVTEGYERISMHGVRKELLMAQADSLGIPVTEVRISKSASNEEYESNMQKVLTDYQRRGVNQVVFGDIFLEDLRRYREEQLSTIGMKAGFPIWKEETALLSRRF